VLELVLQKYERIGSHVGVKQCAVPVVSFCFAKRTVASAQRVDTIKMSRRPSNTFSWSPSSCRRGTRRPDVHSLHRVVANTPVHVSPAMLAGIQNPCPVGERDIDALLPKRRT
jgi:hypothetical protein